MRTLSIFFSLLLITSCDDNSAVNEPELKTQPSGGPEATCVYNHAYQENYEPDPIALILEQAKNSYVLVDPYEDGVSEVIEQIKGHGNEVGAYITIGTGESWRDDFDQLEPYLVAKQWGEWEGEYFVNEVNTGVIEVLKMRIDWIAAIGCDWVEFDNMDWVFDDDLRSEYGFGVTIEEGIVYSNALCDYVQSKGMKCMAKNTTEGVDQFEGVLYESYADEKNWWDTDGARSFLSAGKLVVINHYGETQCDQVYVDYLEYYGQGLSYLCESMPDKAYKHYNQTIN